jgi:transcriptional regulator with GAF, ATPase, and Fis domain
MTGESPELPQLADTLSDLARALQHEASPEATLAAITEAAVDTVPGAEHAGITVVHNRRDLETLSATSDVVVEIDRRQYSRRQGPCLDALWEQHVVRMNDRDAEKRWPEFTADIRDLGIATMCCFRLFTQQNTLGALNLYAAAADSFDVQSEQVGLLFASHAAVALADAQRIEQLEQAVDSRDIIGQAKGILMERFRISADEAFRLLVSASQRTHVKLRDLAEQVARTGQNPETVTRH